MAAAKLAVADRLPIDIIGAVLNGVGSGGEYYYYSYAGGYSVSDGSENGDGDSTKQIPETVGS